MGAWGPKVGGSGGLRPQSGRGVGASKLGDEAPNLGRGAQPKLRVDFSIVCGSLAISNFELARDIWIEQVRRYDAPEHRHKQYARLRDL